MQAITFEQKGHKYYKVLPMNTFVGTQKMTLSSKPLSIKLEPSVKKRIEDLAEARQRSTHWMMREAITQFVEREEKKEAFRKDTLNAWKEFQATGLHVTAAEVEKWIATWGTDADYPPPECQK
jgi:predicted transcriptional regulator